MLSFSEVEAEAQQEEKVSFFAVNGSCIIAVELEMLIRVSI